MGIFQGQLGLADTAQPVDRPGQNDRRAIAGQSSCSRSRMASRPVKSAFLFGMFQICGTAAPEYWTSVAWSGVKYLKLQAVCGHKGADDQARVAQSLAESIYRAAIGVTQFGRAGRVLQQEVSRGMPTKVAARNSSSVRDLLTCYERAILESDYGHVDLAFANPLLAVIGRVRPARRNAAC